MSYLLDKISQGWCKTMHPAPMWPIHGAYQCRVCLRRYPVAWETKPHNDSHAAHEVAMSQALVGEGR
jgi:hypothetical protein